MPWFFLKIQQYQNQVQGLVSEKTQWKIFSKDSIEFNYIDNNGIEIKAEKLVCLSDTEKEIVYC